MKRVTDDKSKGRDFWGPCQWKSLHSIAASYKPCNAHAFLNYVNSLSYLLPCEQCCQHLGQNLKKFPVEPYLGNNHDLFFWTYLLHDAVNQSHNKDRPNEPKKYSPSFDEIKNYYFKAITGSCQDCEAKK
ncbi:MAG TPA: ERV1/ALR-related protein [Saprospiraceae bacterium]|nr:ERV1/ALR-related protein [Saprospiraceae bacterium]